jgi:hypothetical protein
MAGRLTFSRLRYAAASRWPLTVISARP